MSAELIRCARCCLSFRLEDRPTDERMRCTECRVPFTTNPNSAHLRAIVRISPANRHLLPGHDPL